MPQKKIFIQGMHCRSCEILLEEELSTVPQVTRVAVNHRNGTAVVVYDQSAPSDTLLTQKIKQAGYTVTESHTAPSFFSRDIETYVTLLFALGGVFLAYLVAQYFGWFNISLGGGSLDASRLGWVLLIGLTAGISTCAALIGGLVLGVAARYNALHPELTLTQKFTPHLWFNTGRVIGFGFFGALLGMLGSFLQTSLGFSASLVFFAGLVMLFLGLQLSGIFPRLQQIALPKGLSRFFGIQKRKDKEYSHTGSFILGALTFFLPCGFTQAVQLSVIALGSGVLGALAMATFALGTVPGLLLLAGIGTVARGGAKQAFFAVIALLLIAFGLFNMSNGLQLFGITLPTLGGGQSSGAALAEPTKGAPLEQGVQIIRITQDATGYQPKNLPKLQAGVPVRLIIDSQDSYTCASSFVIPQLGVQKRLKLGENIIEFTPTESGSIPFSCSMGMYRGVLQVK